MIARSLCALVGLALVGCECWGVFDFLYGQQREFDYVVAIGVLIAAVAPLLPSLAMLLWRKGRRAEAALACIVFPLAVALVLLSGVNRMGSATDAIDAAMTKSNRSYELAQEAKDRARSALDDATTAEREECAGKGEKGKQCKAERGNLAAAQARYDATLTALNVAPTERTNSLARRVARLLPVSEEQVGLYVPIMWPLVAFIVGTLFLSAGLHSDRKVITENLRNPAPAPPLQVEHLALPHSKPNVVPIRPAKGKVSQFIIASINPAPGSKIEAGEALTAYRAWCKSQGLEPVSVATFAAELNLICGRVGIRTKADGEHVYCLDVQLAS